MLNWQVNGHGVYGEKGQKGEPAVIEPVSILEISCSKVLCVSSYMTEMVTRVCQ